MGKRGYNPKKGKYSAKKRRGAYKAPSVSAAKSAQRFAANAASRGILGIEKGWKDYLYTVNVPNTGAATIVDTDHHGGDGGFQVSRGDAADERNGARMTITNFNLKGRVNFKAPVVSLDENTMESFSSVEMRPVRVWLVLDTQTNGTLMSATDFIKTATGTDGTLNFRRVENMERFKVLDVKTVHPKQPNLVYIQDDDDIATKRWVGATSQTVPFSLNYNGKEIVQRLTPGASGASIANVIDNSLHVVVENSQEPWGIEGGTTHKNEPLIELKYHARLRFFG